MAHNTRVRAAFAAWASGVVTQAEWNKFDVNQFQSINGDLGGVWAPVDAIEIGGAGMVLSGLLEVNDNAEFNDRVDFTQNTHFYDIATFHEGVSLGVDAADAIEVNGESTFSALATFDENAEFNDRVDFTDDVHFYEVVAFNADVTLGDGAGDDITVYGSAVFNAAARWNEIADFYDNVVVHTGASFSVYDDCFIGQSSADDLLVEASARFNSPSDFYDDVTIHTGSTFQILGNATLGNTSADEIDMHGTPQIRTRVTFLDDGRVPLRPVIGATSSTTYTVSDANLLLAETIDPGTTYTISNTGAANGDEMWVANSSDQDLLVAAPGDGSTVLSAPPPGDFPSWLRYVRIGSAWKRFQMFDPYAP